MNILKVLLLSCLLSLVFISCDKKEKLNDNDVDPNSVQFLVLQPSIAIAQFNIKCTNYDISIDTISYLSPEPAVYTESFNSLVLSKNESFTAGSWNVADGIWVITFKGKILETNTAFEVSQAHTMNIDEDDE